MATYKISWLEKKNEDWIVATLADGSTEIKEVSINRTNKKGETFPNFDGIMNGGEIEGELWTSSAGKNYLFAPKPKMAQGGGFKAKQVEEAQVRKEGSINRVLDRKEESIAFFAAQRDAVLIMTTIMSQYPGGTREDEIKADIIKWRDWFLSKEFTDTVPF